MINNTRSVLDNRLGNLSRNKAIGLMGLLEGSNATIPKPGPTSLHGPLTEGLQLLLKKPTSAMTSGPQELINLGRLERIPWKGIFRYRPNLKLERGKVIWLGAAKETSPMISELAVESQNEGQLILRYNYMGETERVPLEVAYEFPEVLGKPPASWEKLDELLCKITPCGEPPVYAYVREVTYDHNTRRLHFGDEFIDLSATRAEPIGRARFRRMIKNTIELVRNGDPLPEEFSQELVSYKKPPVLRLSDNVDPTNLQQAIELGNQTFFARPVVILDGLPHGDKNGKVTGGELKLMGLKRSQRAGWQDLRKSIAERKMPITKASAERVKEQLLRGHENILFLIAHNDGKHIYLPSGERLSMEELSLLKRDTSPDRVIVLVTCYGLRSSEGLEKSLAKTFVQNRFAKTVFATHETFDARSVPGLLDRLRTNNTPLREILQEYGLQQIVKLLRGGEANVLA